MVPPPPQHRKFKHTSQTCNRKVAEGAQCTFGEVVRTGLTKAALHGVVGHVRKRERLPLAVIEGLVNESRERRRNDFPTSVEKAQL